MKINVEGRDIFSIEVDRKDLGTGDCTNYKPKVDIEPRSLDSYTKGLDMELNSVIHKCKENLDVSENCYLNCSKFVISGSVKGDQVKRHGIPISNSYYIYYNPDISSKLFATPLDNGWDKEEAEKGAKFVVSTLKNLL